MDFLEQLANQLNAAAKKPNVLSYIPNSPVHDDFHKSSKVGRILKGGNRSGKSVAGVVESINRATGRHPHYKTHDLPIRGRIVTVDKDNGITQIIKPLLQQWVPPSELINGSWEDSWTNRGSVLTFRNGSTIEVKTHQQETESFAGIPLHFVWFDEECPKAIFNECRLRLIDFNGCWYMTMTPVEGQEWISDRFLVNKVKNVDVFEVDITDNPHLSSEALTLLDEDLDDDEDEKQIRQKGTFVPRGGLILRQFDPHRHVISLGPIPPDWIIYVSIDHGFNTPSAILWHAVSPRGNVVTFREHYMARWTIDKHVVRIKEINAEIEREPFMYVGDPSMSQKTGQTGTSPLQIYRDHGVPLIQAKKDVDGRINKMNEYFEHDKWHISDRLPNTIKEFRGYAFEVFTSPKIADRNNKREKPKKKNDHCPDSAGYFFTYLPYLGPVKTERSRGISQTITSPEDFPWDIDSDLYRYNEEDYAFGEI